MTPSEKPERSGTQSEQDANRTSVITHATDDSDAGSSSDEPDTSYIAEDGAGAPDGTEVPPPWQRTSTTSSSETTSTGASGVTPGEQEQTGSSDAAKSLHEQDTVRTEVPVSPASGDTGRAERPESFAASSAHAGPATATSTSSRRPSRGPRRASLQVKRVDPWSVLKLALVLSVALFFVWMIAVAVLYGVLDGMGVWDQLNGTFTELTQSDNTASESLISAGRVFSVASIIGGINIILLTALSTVAAFIYNVAADFAGGIELTLSERE